MHQQEPCSFELIYLFILIITQGKSEMDLWKSYIQLLAKLQFFTRIGTVVWALPSMLLLIWFCFSRFISFSTVFAAFSVFTVTVWVGFLALIPFCICGLREYVALAVSEKQGQVTISKPPEVLAPPKLIWLSTAISLAEVVIQIDSVSRRIR